LETNFKKNLPHQKKKISGSFPLPYSGNILDRGEKRGIVFRLQRIIVAEKRNQNRKKESGYRIHSLYKDFFSFLRSGDTDKWKRFQDLYLQKDRDFFTAYLSSFKYSKSMLRERVERIKNDHYMNLENLIRSDPPEPIIEKTIQRCISVFSPEIRVEIYLIVGFFSADGFVIRVREKPIIGIGLERYHTFMKLDIIVAHEFAHLVRNVLGFERKGLASRMISEGIATVFSELLIGERTLPDHLFLSNEEFNYLLLHKSEIFNALRKIPTADQGGLGEYSKRITNFMGYILVRDYIENNASSLTEILKTDTDILIHYLHTNFLF
jgi:hypothetical protein